MTGYASDLTVGVMHPALGPHPRRDHILTQIHAAALARQAPLVGAVAAGRRPVFRPPRCSSDAPPPPPKPTRGRKKAVAPKDGAAAAAAADGSLGEAAMLKLSKPDLQALAQAKGVPKSGTKAQIVARILGAEGGATAGATPAAAAAPTPAKKPRAPRKKAAVKEKGVQLKTASVATARASEDPARMRAVLEGQVAAVAAAAAVVAAMNRSARVLWGQQDALDAAIKVSAALSVKWSVLEGHQHAIAAPAGVAAAANHRQQAAALATGHQEAIHVTETAAQSAPVASAEAPAAAAAATDAAAAEPALPPPGSRRKLSPTEATRVLEEIARRKGAGDTSAGPSSAEVERARQVMAALRADLEEQERRTQQLTAVIARGAASAQLTARRVAPAAEAGEGQGEGEHSITVAAPSSPGSGKAAPSSSPAIEFVGAVVVAVGRVISLALTGGPKAGR